jgi:hypothetical protein
MTTARTTDPLVPPVTAEDLEDFAVIPATDPAVTGTLLSATGAVFRYLGFDLIAREWTLTLWDWPVLGTRSYLTLGKPTSELDREIDLPYANLLSVESVELYGEEVTDFIKRDRAIIIRRRFLQEDYKRNESPAIKVTYTAGYGPTADDVPGEIKQAILMVASFLYEHRGACDVMDAIGRSGAAEMLQPYVNPSNVVVM